jgi:hypothetical protein
VQLLWSAKKNSSLNTAARMMGSSQRCRAVPWLGYGTCLGHMQADRAASTRSAGQPDSSTSCNAPTHPSGNCTQEIARLFAQNTPQAQPRLSLGWHKQLSDADQRLCLAHTQLMPSPNQSLCMQVATPPKQTASAVSQKSSCAQTNTVDSAARQARVLNLQSSNTPSTQHSRMPKNAGRHPCNITCCRPMRQSRGAAAAAPQPSRAGTSPLSLGCPKGLCPISGAALSTIAAAHNKTRAAVPPSTSLQDQTHDITPWTLARQTHSCRCTHAHTPCVSNEQSKEDICHVCSQDTVGTSAS